MLATFTVNVAYDTTTTDLDNTVITLREAIFRANLTQAHDDIIFAPNLNNATITLGKDINGSTIGTGELVISESVTIDGTIDGDGPSEVSLGITIDADGGADGVVGNFNGFRIFNIQDVEHVEINSLKLTGGDAPTPGESGGAINYLFFGEPPAGSGLTIKNSEITGNASFDRGGGIFVVGNLRIENSTISDNRTGIGNGGGIFFSPAYDHLLDVVSSTISGNRAVKGAGIYAMGTLASANIVSSRVVDNEAETTSGPGSGGGGIHFDGKDLNIQWSEISGNLSGSSGGGLNAKATNGSITIGQSVIENNRVYGFNSAGGGAYLLATNSMVSVSSSVVGSSDPIKGNRALGLEANVAGIGINVSNNSSVVVDRLNVINNHADDDVGGLLILNTGSTVAVKNSMISGNSATHQNGIPASYDAAGGAWLETTGGTTSVESCTVSDNTSTMFGGGVFIKSPSGTTTIVNSTISGNEAQLSGGGIKIMEVVGGGQVNIRHSTITDNRADSDNDLSGSGGGIHVGSSSTTVVLDHAIVAKNFKGSGSTRDDIITTSPVAVAASWSLIGDRTGATIADNGGNQVGTGGVPIDPLLGPLAYNGGPTFLDGSRMLTHAPLSASSPVIDRGDPNAIPGQNDVPNHDQRGEPFARRRNVPGVNDPGDIIDIGAYEVGAPKVIDVAISTSQVAASTYSYADVLFGEAEDSGIQLRTVMLTKPDIVDIKFDQPTQVSANHLKIWALSFNNSHQLVTPPALKVNGFTAPSANNGYTARWEFASAFPVAQYVLSLSDSVTGVGSVALDGEWVNPHIWMQPGTNPTPGSNPGRSNFPSGDGVAGEDFNFVFTYALGIDNAVGNNELTALLDHWGQQVNGPDNGDFDGSGSVGNGDLTLLLDNWGIDLNLLRIWDLVGDDFEVTAADVAAVNADVDGDGDFDSTDIDWVFDQIGLKYVYV